MANLREELQDMLSAASYGIANGDPDGAQKSISDALMLLATGPQQMTTQGEELECGNCGSHALTWAATMRNRSGVVEGRLRTSDVECVFVLGCDDCSETVRICTDDDVAARLTGPQS